MIEKEYLPNFKTANMVIENHTITYDWGETTTVPENTYIICLGAEVTRHYMKVLAKELITRTNSKVILIDLPYPYHGDSFGDDSLIPNINIHYYTYITAKFI